jgi:ParB family chromosome partitioning protein
MDKAKRIGDIHSLKISDIDIGERARDAMGDIDSMALSLQIEGQLLPIVVDLSTGGRYKLVEGERRIRAALRNNWTHIECIMLETLTDLRRDELELIHCLQRKQLDFLEEARAVKRLTDKRKKEGIMGGMAKFGRSVRNKDVAMELNMTESRMSENLRIAEADEDHPELAAVAKSRTEFLRKIRNKDFYVQDGGTMQSKYKENFIVTTPMGCVETVNDKIVDLAILDPDRVDSDLFEAVYKRLKIMGQVIVFCPHADIHTWEEMFKAKKMNIGMQPYIWHIKGEGNYQNFIWAAKNLTSPNKPMTNMITASKPVDSLSVKSKPIQLVSNIIKCCTDKGSFILVPQCEDIETVRCAIEMGRNIRAASANKILRDRLILSVSQ